MSRPIYSRAFTLVEILVVVAILAILSAIAIPNLLEAQTRSKVARAKADLRSLATAIEAYTADYSLPPLDWNVPRGDPQLPGMNGSTSGITHPGYADSDRVVHAGLTTPVAYIANSWITDPFVGNASYDAIPFDQQKYTYKLLIPARGFEPNQDYIQRGFRECYGAWYLFSVGPDRAGYNGGVAGDYPMTRVYDPTNGSISSGNIWRSQREPDVHSRPEFDAWAEE